MHKARIFKEDELHVYVINTWIDQPIDETQRFHKHKDAFLSDIVIKKNLGRHAANNSSVDSASAGDELTEEKPEDHLSRTPPPVPNGFPKT